MTEYTQRVAIPITKKSIGGGDVPREKVGLGGSWRDVGYDQTTSETQLSLTRYR